MKGITRYNHRKSSCQSIVEAYVHYNHHCPQKRTPAHPSAALSSLITPAIPANSMEQNSAQVLASRMLFEERPGTAQILLSFSPTSA